MKKTDTQLIPSGDQTRIPKPLASSAASAESASEYAPEDSFAEVVRRYGVDEQALARALIMKLLLRVDQLFGKIEEAFAGQALIRRLPPDAPANQKWFNAYTAYCGRASKLLEQAVELVRVLSSMTVRTTDSASPPKKGGCRVGPSMQNAEVKTPPQVVRRRAHCRKSMLVVSTRRIGCGGGDQGSDDHGRERAYEFLCHGDQQDK